MDWMMGIGGLVVFASAFVAAGAVRKSMKMKQEVDLFADQVEEAIEPVSYTHLTLPTSIQRCRSRWSPYH